MPEDDSDRYPLRRSPEETQRLMLQQEVIGESTTSFLREAGVNRGMAVLDIGSGAGDVALTVAALVGASGSVLGVDIDPTSAAEANERAHRKGAANVRFEAADALTHDLTPGFDFVTGRLVLMHVPDPVAMLTRVASLVTPGGGIAFQEPVLTSPWMSYPLSPSLRAADDVRRRAIECGQRVNPHIGLDLRSAFTKAGLPEPQLHTSVMVAKPAEGSLWFEATIRSLLPGWLRLGVPGADSLTVDGLAERIRTEVGPHGTLMMYPLIGAWVRLP